jgi:hypothetical protein
MTPTTTNAELPQDLVDRVMELTPEGRSRLMELICEADLPPGSDEGEIARRLNSVIDGTAKLLTREESEAAIREEMRKLGVEL